MRLPGLNLFAIDSSWQSRTKAAAQQAIGDCVMRLPRVEVESVEVYRLGRAYRVEIQATVAEAQTGNPIELKFNIDIAAEDEVEAARWALRTMWEHELCEVIRRKDGSHRFGDPHEGERTVYP